MGFGVVLSLFLSGKKIPLLVSFIHLTCFGSYFSCVPACVVLTTFQIAPGADVYMLCSVIQDIMMRVTLHETCFWIYFFSLWHIGGLIIYGVLDRLTGFLWPFFFLTAFFIGCERLIYERGSSDMKQGWQSFDEPKGHFTDQIAKKKIMNVVATSCQQYSLRGKEESDYTWKPVRNIMQWKKEIFWTASPFWSQRNKSTNFTFYILLFSYTIFAQYSLTQNIYFTSYTPFFRAGLRDSFSFSFSFSQFWFLLLAKIDLLFLQLFLTFIGHLAIPLSSFPCSKL